MNAYPEFDESQIFTESYEGEVFEEDDFEDDYDDEEAEDFADGEILDDTEDFEDGDESYEDDEYYGSGALIESGDDFYDNVDESMYETLLAEAAALSSMPEELKAFPEWREAYAEGVTYHDAVRLAMGPEYATLTDEEADELIGEALADMSPEEIESFLKSLGGIVSKALPAVGGAVGTLVAPGVGTAVGSALGGVAGKALGAATKGRRRRGRPSRGRRAVRTRARRRTRRPRRGRGSTRMRAELMRLLQNPQLLQALAGSILGGRGAARAGDTLQEVNLGAFLGALEHYAQEAAEEAHAEMLSQATWTDDYDDESSMDPAARAEALMDLLDEAAA